MGHSFGWLVDFCQKKKKKESSWKRTPQLETTSIRFGCDQVHGAFSWLMFDVEGYASLWIVLSLGKWSSGV